MSLFKRTGSLRAILLKAAALAALLAASQAQAVPSFARQTGMDCAGCHIGGFGPQLTPAGIRFKLGGYTDSDGQDGKLPLSGMVVASWTKTKTDNPEPEAGLKANNNLKMDEASVFLAGRLTEHMGAFVQATYDGVGKKIALDQTDLRYARTVELGGKETIVGLSLNNNPGVQDPFNTMPVWSFPYVSSPAGSGSGGAASLINGGLEGRVLGTSAYGFFDNAYYAELGSYRSMSPAAQTHLGLGSDQQKLGGNAYWRLGWLKDQKSQAFQLGLFGWNAKLQADLADPASSQYRDIGIDGSYQFLGTREHVATISGSYLNERKTDGASGDASRLHEARLNATYHYQQTWGGGAGLFSTQGSDPLAKTNGYLLQADWTPWGKENASAPAPFSAANLRLGAQYWIYNKLNGASGSDARDRNTLFLFAWTSF